MKSLQNTAILVGITGGIAAYKAAELVRAYRQAGAEVRVVMTRGAQAFVTPLTFAALSGESVHAEGVTPDLADPMAHITLARWADLSVIAPASAQVIAKLAQGVADDLLTTLCLATEAPLAIAPAMNQKMWHHPAVQANCDLLKNRGTYFWGPDAGEQACGDVGLGRMIAPEKIFQNTVQALKDKVACLSDKDANQKAKASNNKGLWIGKQVVITAGPTQEAIDPIRYLTNHSSGKMGYALAQAAKAHGASVTLISGPTALPPPAGVQVIPVTRATDMLTAVEKTLSHCDIFIAAAAVADYHCDTIAPEKIKKSGDHLTINLIPTPDILAHVAHQKNKPLCIGFAAETTNVIDYAKAKLKKKNLDMIIANQVGLPGTGFCSDDNEVTVITKQNEHTLPKQSKQTLAYALINLIETTFLKKEIA